MRILFISRFFPYIGGREAVVLFLANKLSEKHTITVATPDIGRLAKEYKVIPNDKESLDRLFKSSPPDIVNIHTFYLCSDYLVKLCHEYNIPIVATIHGDFFNFGTTESKKIFKKTINSANHIISVCKHGAQEMTKRKISANKITTIKNGVDTKIFKKLLNSKASLRQTLGLPLRKKLFITPARMTPYKGIEFLIKTIDGTKLKNAYFIVVTPPTRYKEDEMNYMNYLLKIVNKNKINNFEIRFADYSTMPFLYQACDFLIMSSKTEQMPLAIIEAMASNVPVIATNVGGVSEVVKNNINGILVSYGNMTQLRKAIKMVYKNNLPIASIKRQAYNLIKKEHSADSMAESYENLFKKLIHKKYEER